ncbi:hypothetical protein LWF15_08560 [Kineosporia rhizophila]|uniref:hypothetical protein n=1 Tax=Kineosporia TaxID=49184 RepID=UPI001E60608A|nr:MULTISPECIES: hypothetical protein [Kineosporia]MCE0535560.1 hypothetical protein [Kineosporia rhizophila]GLY16645.1 hypothetical protein Kisp01_36600 [Kineosporia sp. NBRC 101677]
MNICTDLDGPAEQGHSGEWASTTDVFADMEHEGVGVMAFNEVPRLMDGRNQ